MRETVDVSESIHHVSLGRYLITAAFEGRDSIQRSFRVVAFSEVPEPRLGVVLPSALEISDLVRQSRELAVNVVGPQQIAAPRPPRAERPPVKDEFVEIGAVRIPASKIRAPLVAECAAYVEGAVEEEFAVGDRSLFVCRALVCQVDPSIVPVVRVRGRNLNLSALLDNPAVQLPKAEAPVPVRTTLTYDLARRMVDAAMGHARGRGLSTMTVAVVDAAGTLLALGRMEGANFIGPDVARGKAYASAAFRIPSADVAERAENHPGFYGALSNLTDGKFVAAQGALPVVIDGRVVGAIGAAGSKPPVDEAVAQAGLAVLSEGTA